MSGPLYSSRQLEFLTHRICAVIFQSLWLLLFLCLATACAIARPLDS